MADAAAPEGAAAEGAEEVEDYKFTPAELNAGLLAAAKVGHRGLVERLFGLGALPDFEDAKHWSALDYASFYGHHRVVEVLLQHGAGEAIRDGGAGAEPNDGLASPSSGQHGRNAAGSARIVNSPLHHAVSRLHIRCVWALLQAGFSPLDVDQYGNNCLHLAAASSVPNRPLQAEVLRSLMTQGHDAGLRNWLGQTPLDLLPQDAAEARELLRSSISHTKCAVTGTPFGQDKMRHLCFASGQFVCDEAAVASAVKAFAPAVPGTTIAGEAPAPVTASLAEPFPYEHGVGGLPVASLAGDTGLTRPVRYAAEVAYKVSDAEGALQGALDPFTASLEEAFVKWVEETTAARAAAVVKAQEEHEARLKAEAEERERKAKEEEEARLKAEAEAAAAAAAAPPPKGKKGKEEKAASRPPSGSKSKAGSRAASAKSVRTQAEGGDGEGEQADAAPAPAPEPAPFIPPTFPPLPVTFPEPEPDLFFTEGHTTAVQQGLTQVREVKGDAHLQAKALGALRRLKAAGALKEACAALSSARPLPDTTHAAYTSAQSALAAAQAAGVGSTLLAQAALAMEVAAGEVELAGAVAVASTVAIGTHAFDAYIARLGEAVARGKELSARAKEAGSDEVPEGVFPLRKTLGVPTGNDILPPAIKDDTVAEAEALLTRLKCEVQVTDALAAARDAGAVAAQAAITHKEEDPTLLPVPELPAVPVDPAAAAAAAPPARPPSGKGGKDAAPAEPPAPPPPNPDFPCDQAGVPLPDTPQLVTLRGLRKACTDLETIIVNSKAAGADAACIDGASAGLAELQGQFTAGLTEEANRVGADRAEKAKAAKKGKKKGK